MMRLLKLICIKNDISDKVTNIENRDTQGLESLNKELEIDK